ncbi:MAG: type II secretion system protein [Candidatus Nealsonbacteria bacterium]
MSQSNNAFTLIELLVVIAIIGFLSSVILLNMRGTRLEAHDAVIQSLLHDVRNLAELKYAENNESYSFVCDEGDDTISNTGDLLILELAIKKENNNQDLTCIESVDKQAFAVSSPMRFLSDKHWCVQSAGTALELDHFIITPRCE